jgi:hypothetical protein
MLEFLENAPGWQLQSLARVGVVASDVLERSSGDIEIDMGRI